MRKEEILQSIRGGLIVSCQALEDEPLHSSFIMSRMAYAAMLGGAVGIRANSGIDIKAIKEVVNIPVIGLSKVNYENSPVYITPTLKEVKEVVEAGSDIVALDATDRLRPGNISLRDFVSLIRKEYPNIILMGDISKVEEGIKCEKLGFDMVSTTLSSYTEDTKNIELPNIELIKSLKNSVKIPIIAEGGVWRIEDIKRIKQLDVHSVVIGSAITRPKEITKRYVEAMEGI